MSGLDITVLRPLWLLALPVLAAFGWMLWRRQGALGDWGRAADRALLAAMARLGRVDEGGTGRPLALLLTAAALVVLGLSGPAVERRDTLSFRNLDGVIFVVDASSSMTEAVSWTEMQTVGRFGLSVLGTRPGAVIVYAGDAYVATDMTRDHLQLGQSFLLIGPKTVPDPGSRPERALALAVDVLEAAEVIAGDVVLFTDGGGLGPASLGAAEAIAARGARLSLVAAEAGPGMKAHATVGGGQVFGLADVDAMARFLAEDGRTRLERQDTPLLFWRDMGRYLLLLALLPVAWMFGREAT